MFFSKLKRPLRVSVIEEIFLELNGSKESFLTGLFLLFSQKIALLVEQAAKIIYHSLEKVS
jgi:hypothetical protein